jgi:hypothetical protein
MEAKSYPLYIDMDIRHHFPLTLTTLEFQDRNFNLVDLFSCLIVSDIFPGRSRCSFYTSINLLVSFFGEHNHFFTFVLKFL